MILEIFRAVFVWLCGANGILIMQNSLSCTPILLLLEGKRGCFA